MIVEYHRPQNIDEALFLLSREFPPTIPLGGGNYVAKNTGENIAVVDLQNLGLNKILVTGAALHAGATSTLEDLFTHPTTPKAIKEAIHVDATLNTRNTATIAGAVVAGTGQSALLTALLAMDARLNWLPGNNLQAIGEFVSLKTKIRPGKMIDSVKLSLQTQIRLATVGRSPLDPPFLIVAISKWPSGRTRLVLGGKVTSPILAMDGLTEDGIVEAGINACSHLSNQWISKNYLKDTIPTLIHRLTEG